MRATTPPMIDGSTFVVSDTVRPVAVARLRRAMVLSAVVVLLAALFACTVSSLSASFANADTLRIGKAGREAFSFVPLDVGIRKGFFAKNGLDIESIAFTGDARMQQAMASDSLDIALGSGPAMAFIVKGAPIKGVAAMAGPLAGE